MRKCFTSNLIVKHVRSLGGTYMCLFCLSCLSIAHAQAPPSPIIHEAFEQVALTEVFKLIHKEYRVFFSYSKKNVAGIVVNATIDHKPLPEAMSIILQGTSLEYEIVDEIFVLILPKKAPAQTAPRICGWIKDAETGQPLAYTNVRLLGAKAGTISKQDGSFYMSGFFPPDSQVMFSYLGYEPLSMTYQMLSKRGCQTILLDKQATEIPGVVISEYLADGINQAGNAITLAPKKVQALPGLTEPDVLQLVQVLPGVNGPDETAAGIHLRGGTPDQTLIRMDGIPIYQTGHFFDMIFATNPFAVAEAKVYRGGYDASQPGRVSGVIDMNQGNQIPQQVEGGLTLNLTHVGATLSLPLDSGKLAVFLSGRRAITDLIPSIPLNRWEERIFQNTRIGDQNEEAESGSEIVERVKAYAFSDWNAKILFKPNAYHQVTLSHFGSANRMHYDFMRLDEQDEVYDELNIDNMGLGVEWRYQGRGTYRSTQSASLSRFHSQYDHSILRAVENQFDWELSRTNFVEDIRFQSDHRWQLSTTHQFQTGFQLISQIAQFEMDLYYRPDDWRDDKRNYDSTISGAIYVGYHFTPSDKWDIQVSDKVRVYSQADAILNDPRIAVTFRPTPHLRIRAHSGIYHQVMAQLIEWQWDELGVNQQVWALADGVGSDEFDQDREYTPVIRSIHHGIGLTYDHKGWLLDVEAYAKDLQNLTSLTTTFITANQLEDESLVFALGDATVRGVDILLRKRWKRMRSWISYSLSRTDYIFPAISAEPFAAPHDQRHVLSINHLVNWKHIELGLGWSFRTGKPYTPRISDTIFSHELEEIPGLYEFTAVPQLAEINSFRLPAYHRLDLSIAYVFEVPGWQGAQGRIGCSILNMYDQYNLLSIQYFRRTEYDELPGPSFSSERIEKSLLGITPNLLLRLSF